MSNDTTDPEGSEPAAPQAKAGTPLRALDSVGAYAPTLPRAELEGPSGDPRQRSGSGRYELRGELGRGGQSVVWRAWDRQLEREVAVKELAGDSSDAARQRFLREALITARLEHPNIVPVYEVGQRADGTLYTVQKLVRSSLPGGQTRTLRAALADAPTLEQRLLLLPQFLAVCQGVAYAHAQGVLHRDLKPENVVLGQFGETVILDWGLARATGDASRPTQGTSGERYATLAGVAYGTPAYMSPEQARGETTSLDERADVWSLGAMLFELLTGRPPFLGRGAMDVVELVKTARIPAARELEPRAPPSLAAVAARALQRDPEARYRSAQAFADELVAWQAGRAVSVYRYTPLELLKLFVGRNQKLASVALAAILAVLVLAAEALARYRDARSAAAHALVEKARAADRQRDWNLAALYSLTARAFDDNPETQWSVRVLGQRGVSLPARLVDQREGVFGLAYSPDGALLATAGQGGVVRVYRARDGALQGTVSAHSDDATGVCWSSDGTRLASSGVDGRARLFAVAGLQPLAELAARKDPVNKVALSPDGRWAFSGDERGVVTRAELATGALVTFSTDEQPRHPIYGLAVDPRGERLALVTWSGLLELRSFEGELLQAVPRLAPMLLDVKYSPDGRRLAIAGSDRSVRLYDLDPSGKVVLSSLRLLEGHGSKVYAVAFSADSTRLASASTDRTVRLWNVADARPWPLSSVGGTGELEALSLSPDGERVAVGGPANPVALYALKERDAVYGVPGRYEGLQSAPGLGLGLAATLDGPRAFGDADGAERARAQALPESAQDLSVSRDGRAVAWPCDRDRVCVAPLPALRPVQVLVYPFSDDPAQIWRAIRSVGLAPDGTWVAAADLVGGMRLWTLPDGVLKHRFERGSGRGQAAGSRDGHSNAVYSIDASPDGRRFATGSYDRTVRLWSVATGDLLSRLEGHQRGIRRVRFAPDGRLLASAGWDRKVRLWDVESAALHATCEGHEDHVYGLDWSPDGTWLATGSRDGTVRVWDPRGPTCRPLASLTTEEGAVYGVAVWGNGQGLWYSGVAVRRFPFKPLLQVGAQLNEIERATGLRIDEKTFEPVPLRAGR